MRASLAFLSAAGIAAALCSCVQTKFVTAPRADREDSEEAAPLAVTRALRSQIDTIVIIYAENRAFDNLYGNFPDARNLSEVIDRDGRPLPAYHPQLDRDGKVLSVLPPTWGGVTAAGVTPVVTQQQSVGLPNAPFSIEHGFTAQSQATLTTNTVTRDLWHRFYEHQMQIDGGKNDGFAAWSDAGGLALGYYDYSGSALYALAYEFVLADNFFQGAFGGSFLNHQYLICACAPEYPNADTAAAKPAIAVLEKNPAGGYLPRLKTAGTPAASALDQPPTFAKSGDIAPLNYFGDGKFYAVNTMQPPYQPSRNKPAAGDAGFEYADPNNATTLPPQTQRTIGDALDAKGVAWAWYAGAWNAAVKDGTRPPAKRREVIYAPETAGGNPDFQAHHQPFNYYERFDPHTHAEQRAAHLKDYDDLLADIAAGKLPAVAFYKPQGNLNQHAGYASLAEGDAHIADLVAKLRAGPQWDHMLIVITYDEFGGAWDHVAPPAGDLLGPGTRIPALIISPFAKRHAVDHTQYDTESILRLITRRFDLEVLPGIVQRDAALLSHGAPPMGDLTYALDLP
ncbi:MAG TPA: acid phosphatase [Steroidobacteraceae bacterium]|jgi:acid phosphatase|nr:acid phosphatase [Steroidobacteraceae bacterium]